MALLVVSELDQKKERAREKEERERDRINATKQLKDQVEPEQERQYLCTGPEMAHRHRNLIASK